MKLVIGIAGQKGSGKDTFAMLLQEHLSTSLPNVSVRRCRSSEILSETLEIWHLPKTRKNLQDVAIIMDKNFGTGTLTRALRERMVSMTEDIILFDAVRWHSDVEMIRNFPKNLLVYITAPLETRYARSKSRKEKVGEEFATLEQFKREEQAATELDIATIGGGADICLDNSATRDDFALAIGHFSQNNIEPLLQSN